MTFHKPTEFEWEDDAFKFTRNLVEICSVHKSFSDYHEIAFRINNEYRWPREKEIVFIAHQFLDNTDLYHTGPSSLLPKVMRTRHYPGQIAN